jgi:hypothetical protein
MSERTKSNARAAFMTLVAALLLPANARAIAPEEAEPQGPNPFVSGLVTGLEIGFDVLILRPLGLVTMAVGAGAFVPAALIASPMGRDGIEPALSIFVTDPAKHVFQRPLGDF